MIVDCHTHIKLTAEDTESSEHLAAAETVDVCIVLATSDGPSEEVNKKLSQYVNKHKEKMAGFAVVEPGTDKISTNHLKSIPDKLGLKGAVLYCSACGFHPTHSRAMRFYESAQELGLPVFFHNAIEPTRTDAVLEYAQPFLLDEVAREFANLKIIIGNMGVPFVEQTLSMVARHKNVYADLTICPGRVWQTYNMVMAAYEHGVMDKLLFGSGFPLASAGQCIETLLGFNMLLADTNLPTVPRVNIRNIIERDTLELLGIKEKSPETEETKSEKTKGRKSISVKKEKGKKTIMTELLEERRESWGTRGGFILAAIGSAVGLGNLWGFPYKLYSYGGGAFLIPYIVALLVIGIPIMILEFSIGHYTQRAAPDAFKRGHKHFEMVGWWGIILAFVIITYYPVILAYCFSFLWYSIVGIFSGGELPWAGKGIEGVENAKLFFNETYLGKIDIEDARFYLGSIRWNLVLPLIITWAAMYFCIFKGVRLVGKIVWLTVPLPWLMLAILAVRGLTLEGSMQGLAYYLDPVWSELTKPVTWRYAIGQVFFSLSLAYGVMITYASFLHRKSDINNNAAIISIADFATSFVAGLAVFATLGGMAFVTQQAGNPVAVENVAEAGPSLAFVAFPYALAQLPYSAWFSFVFFFALVTLGIDSAFSMTESILASIIDKTGWRRCIVLPVLSVVGFLFGVIYITRAGFNWLGAIDGFVNGTWGIAFMGLLECIVLGWLWRIGTLRRHANSRSDWQLGRWYDYLIRMVIPVVLGALFFWQLFDDISGGGFLRTSQGEWILPNCVGLSIVALVPIVAIILSLTRGRADIKEPERPEQSTVVGGKAEGTIAFFAALIIAGLLIVWLKVPMPDIAKKTIIGISLIGGIAAMLLSNYLLDKHHTSTSQASWFARWAGILAVTDTSASIAIILIALAQGAKVDKAAAHIRDELSGVSYVILAVVFLIIIGGLGWCFYRALTAAGKDTDIQHPDEE